MSGDLKEMKAQVMELSEASRRGCSKCKGPEVGPAGLRRMPTEKSEACLTEETRDFEGT